MTDKELLELAAKAAGIEIQDERVWVDAKETMGGSWEKWNPLTDDDDALRLAVKLHLLESSWLGDMSKEADPYAATRRAIVRAAAEIGKTL